MPEERMLSHVKYDVKRQRLIAMTCRREDMVLPKSTFTIYGTFLVPLTVKVILKQVDVYLCVRQVCSHHSTFNSDL